MKIIENDDLIRLALEGKFDVIVHQCNCFHNFGAGFALSLLRIFPEAFEADKKTTKGDREKMGTISFQGLNIVKVYQVINCL
jgi:O-acetyl-ADP-ribose deacetylase (regulator of RNase III)